MKQIIDGKRYDTDAATYIGNGGSDGNTSVTDFRYWDANLYLTAKGRFFLAGEGGALSMFARSAGQNATRGGAGIIPLSTCEALDFCERHLHPSEYERFFEIENA